uniref:Uncharacterized protein n=1 Tax=Candidatus Kentrum sp. DK TaxID=2126562 RepID=A0A450SGN5_9GAMM|nr:MAG: hypothetical protein BECKDK2373B_GA0170837_103011 [Candidatus Kentron sp. DK]VFJ52227.1 MAG: hypothetical protein BECKDK2373C_GA0170839_103522 [Candidatus Kentron sp. DK]
MLTPNAIDKVVSGIGNSPKHIYDDADSIFSSVTYEVPEEENGYFFQDACHGDGNGGYDLEDVNVAIAIGMADALAHQRGEIELLDIDDAFLALRNEI